VQPEEQAARATKHKQQQMLKNREKRKAEFMMDPEEKISFGDRETPLMKVFFIFTIFI
jgi:hypothetical protein